MQLTPSQLEIARTRPVRTKLNLFLYEPRAVLKCRLNANVSKGAMTIPYGNVITGSYTGIEANMALLVGSSEGAQDYGRVRLRSGSSSQFSVAENDGIQWVSGSYLTVLRYWDILPVYPRIITDPEDNTNVIFYKDYDIPHSGQNNRLGAFINAGSHRSVLLENGSGTAYYSSTGTLSLMGSSMTYDWAFEGGTPTGSTSATPGNVMYTTPGDYATRLRVTTNGITDTTYRYVSVRHAPGNGNTPPILKWKIDGLQGSRDAGGYTARVTIYETVNVQENSLIIISSEEFYGSTKANLGGNNPNGENIFFTGYVEAGSIKYSYDKSSVEFTVSSVTAIMKKSTGYSISVESKQAASTWYELQDMDCRRAIYHYLRWHTTVLLTTDVRFRGDDRKIQFFDADRGSLYDAVNGLMADTLMGNVSSDRQGAIYAEVSPVGYENPTGSFPPVMEITKRDWVGEPAIEYVPYSPSSYVELGGIAYSGASTGTFTAFLSGAPGDVPLEHGSIETDPGGLALTSQAQLNQLSGNVFYTKKHKYPRIQFSNSTPMRNLDIAPYEALQVNITQSDTVSNVAISGLYYPNSMQFSYEPEKEKLTSGMDVSAIVTGIPGDTIVIPEVADDIYDFDANFPNFSFPPFSISIPQYAITDPMSVDNILVWVYNVGFFYTTNGSDPSPSWNSMMANYPLATYGNPVSFEITATGKVFVHCGRYILKSNSLGAPWAVIFDAVPATGNTGVENPESYPFPRSQTVLAMGVNRDGDEDVFILGSLIVTIFSTCLIYGYNWNGNTFTRVNNTYVLSPSSSSRYGWIFNMGGTWMVSYFDISNYATTSNVDRNSYAISNIKIHTGSGGGNSVMLASSKFSPTRAIVKLIAVPSYTPDTGGSWNPISGSAYTPYKLSTPDIAQSMAVDSTGVIVYGRSGLNGYTYSLDGGSSFADSSTLFSGTASAVTHLGQSAYIFGDLAGQLWIVDGIGNSTGTSIANKTGNLSYLITGAFTPTGIRFYDTG